jgi:hypothetical protein
VKIMMLDPNKRRHVTVDTKSDPPAYWKSGRRRQINRRGIS